MGWGPAQFPKRHKVAGWDWDEHLNGYTTTSHRKFACDCGDEHDVPGYRQCKCGKIWNSYVIGTGPDTRTASPEMFIAREIPVRDGVIVANRKMAGTVQDYLDDYSGPGYKYRRQHGMPEPDEDPDDPYSAENFAETVRQLHKSYGYEAMRHQARDGGPGPYGTQHEVTEGFQGEFARDIADHHPDTDQQARYVNYLNRWRDMRDNATGGYEPNSVVTERMSWPEQMKAAMLLMADQTAPHFQPLQPGDAEKYQQRRDAVEAEGTGYNFTGSPETQYHHRQKSFSNDYDEDEMWARQRAGQPLHAALDSPDVVQQEFGDWLMTQGTSLAALQRNPRELQNKLDEFLSARGGGDPADEILQYVGFLKGAPFAGYDDFADCVSDHGDADDPSAYCGEIKHRTEDKHGAYFQESEMRALGEKFMRERPEQARSVLQHGYDKTGFTNTTGPWSGKTPAGPQGSGVGGLKQKTRYKSVSTPQLRSLRQRLMTTPQRGIDMNELLRELSFREVLGTLHDLTAPGATVDADGEKTKRTDPTMSAPVDWSRRRSDGKWTRGDGHSS